MVFAGRKVFSDENMTNRIFTEMYTAKWWHVLQVKILPISKLFLLLTHTPSHVFPKVLPWLQSLSQPTKHNLLNFLATKQLILCILQSGIFPKPQDENLRNMLVSLSPIFQSKSWTIPG